MGVLVQGLLRLPWNSPARGSAAVAALGLVPMLASAVWRASAGRNALRRRIVTVVVVVGGIFVVGATYIAVRTDEILDEAQHAARAGVAAVRDGDRAKASAAFEAAGGDFRRARHFARSWWAWPGRAVPVLAPQLRSLDQVSSVGAEAVDVAREAVAQVDPKQLRFVDGRLDLAAVARDHAVFADAARRTDAIQKRLANLSGMWLAPPIEHAITRFETVVKSAGDSAHTATDALALAPSILGRDGPRTYFIAFVTPAEARGSGGLIANYGILRAKDGRIHLDRVGRAPDLDFEGTNPKHLTGFADYQARYNQFDVANTWANVTMSPDFPTVAQVIAQLYPKSGGEKIDGVMEVGPHGMAGLLALSGPIHIAGLPFDLNEHNIVQFLLHDEYTKITDQQRRANLLGDVARATFDKLTSGTSKQPAQISKIMSPVVRGANSWRSGCATRPANGSSTASAATAQYHPADARRLVRRDHAERRGEQDRLLLAPNGALRRAPRRADRSRRRPGDADPTERRAARRRAPVRHRQPVPRAPRNEPHDPLALFAVRVEARDRRRKAPPAAGSAGARSKCLDGHHRHPAGRHLDSGDRPDRPRRSRGW